MDKTDAGILAGVGLLLAVEAWTLTNKTPNDTISERIWKHAPRRPLIPFAVGVLCGHFFWQAAPDDEVKA